jgi:hypothetical protein
MQPIVADTDMVFDIVTDDHHHRHTHPDHIHIITIVIIN